MKYVANILSISRMVLSISLIYFLNNTLIYISIYIICGLSDVFDGIIARKTNTQSTLGARLDSIADLLMFGIITFSMIVWAGNSLINYLIYIVAIVLIRVINVIIAIWKYKSFDSLHTWGNKFTGLLVFFTPVLFIVFHNVIVILLVCIVSILSALEESVIHLTSKKYDLNRRGILFK
jgi:phosphatidylglycerophosphate synthase